MGVPLRIKQYAGRYALVDGIPFTMPVAAKNSPAFMAGFYCDYKKAAELLPGNQLHPLRLLNGKAIFVVTVVNYLHTTIGAYIEYSLAIAVTRGRKPAPPLLGALFMPAYHTGQFIVDLPVSSEISVKGGKGIWGMPKHQANLDFVIGEKTVSAQYEENGQFAFRIEIDKPLRCNFPVDIGATNYAHFRNMLVASYIYFKSKAGFRLGKKATGRIYIGDHARTAVLRGLNIASKPFFTLFMPAANGILDDYFESWYVTYPTPPETVTPEGFGSVIDLGLSQQWLPAPAIRDYERFKI
jgi:hypothetical protein